MRTMELRNNNKENREYKQRGCMPHLSSDG